MDRLRSFFGGESSSEVPSSSVLAEWNKYSSTDGGQDIETGGAEPSTSLFASTVSQFTDRVTSTVSSTQSAVAESFPPSLHPRILFSRATSLQNWYYFGGFMLGGVIMLFLAFTVALPLVVISPSKFAFCFSVGSLFVLSAFTSLKGWKNQFKHMISKERIWFSAAYMASLLATLYSAVVLKSYLLSLLCCGLQVLALVYYVVSYFPGGAESAKTVMLMLYRSCLSCCGSLFRSTA